MVSDGVLIGIVLGLIFAAVSYYLYSRIMQHERKVGLMENILLDLKVTTEQALMTATEPEQTMKNENDNDSVSDLMEETRDVKVDTTPQPRTQQTKVSVERTSVSVNYESMTYKELVQHAKQKGVSGTRNLSKAQVIDMLRRHDSGEPETNELKSDDLTELLSADQNGGGTSLDDLEVDNSLVG